MKPRIITHNGVSRSLREWEKVTGISHGTILARLYKGWSVERALYEKVEARASRSCVICGTEFSTPPSSKKYACSPECSAELRTASTRKHGCEPARLYGIWSVTCRAGWNLQAR